VGLRFIAILLVLLAHGTKAQFMEFGAGLGTANYTGDLNSPYRISNSGLAGMVHYRLNFSEFFSTRFALALGSMRGNDNRPVDVLAETRDYSFKNGILEASAVFEYHFMDFRSVKGAPRWSPYAFGGFGFMKVTNALGDTDEYNKLQPVLPFGAGVKYLVGKRFALEFELGARKTFFDHLDGISDGDVFIKNYQYGNPSDTDWYFISCIRISYIIHEIPCPFPYIPNQSIYRR
jgi:hypothetical protein